MVPHLSITKCEFKLCEHTKAVQNNHVEIDRETEETHSPFV